MKCNMYIVDWIGKDGKSKGTNESSFRSDQVYSGRITISGLTPEQEEELQSRMDNGQLVKLIVEADE